MSAADKDQLKQALESWGVDATDLADDHASLLSSGLLDSMALFNLSIWLEERLGQPIDPASFDVMHEWDSVQSILRFIETRSVGGATDPVGAVPPTAALACVAAPVATLVATPVATTPEAPSPDAGDERADPRYQIVRYTPDHLQAVGTLLCGLWSPDPQLNQAVFRWKYEHNPFAGEPLIYLALRDGVPVGMRAFCRSIWESEGSAEPQGLYVADDFVVTEAHRNQGLFHLFTEAASADLKALGASVFLSMSALRVTRLQLLATGSLSVGVLPVVALRPAWLKLLDRLAEAMQRLPQLWRLADRIAAGRPASESFARLDAAEPSIPMDGGGLIEFRTQVEAHELAELVARLGHDGRIRHWRNGSFYAWRYRNPMHAYRFVTARRDGRLIGYLVLQRGLSPYANQRRINLVDWACESDAVLAALVRTACRQGQLIDLVTWRNGDAADAEVFEQLGFRSADAHQSRRGLPCILVRSLDDAPAEQGPQIGRHALLSLRNWDLRMAYTSFA